MNNWERKLQENNKNVGLESADYNYQDLPVINGLGNCSIGLTIG